LHDQATDRAAHAGLDRLELAVGLVVLALDRCAQGWIFHLRNFFSVAAGGDFAPRGARIVKVPMLESKREAGAQRRGLAEDRQAFFATIA